MDIYLHIYLFKDVIYTFSHLQSYHFENACSCFTVVVNNLFTIPLFWEKDSSLDKKINK